MSMSIGTLASEAAAGPAPQVDLRTGVLVPESSSRPQLTGILSSGASFLQDLLSRLWAQVRQVRVRQVKKRLRVCETVPLGEKRFVAVIQVDDKQFLVGGASNSVSLLAQLDKPAEFSNVLQRRIAEVDA